MKRRNIIGLVGGAAMWPLAARAQSAGKQAVIGFLIGSDRSTEKPWIEAFVERLRQLGWIDGGNLAIEYRSVEGRNERAAEFAAEFVRRKVDLIVASGTPAASAAKQATSTIPVVFVLVTNPIGSGLIASLARPGGNLTGLTNQQSDLAGKRLGLCREILPGFRRLAVMANIDASGAVLELGEVETAAAKFGLEVTVLRVRRADDIMPALGALKGVDVLYMCADPLVAASRGKINAFALEARLLTSWGNRELAEGGGMMSYGPDFADLFRRAADYADKILRGAKPEALPVEQPTKFELMMNLKTAKALGLAVPPSILAAADEVIE